MVLSSRENGIMQITQREPYRYNFVIGDILFTPSWVLFFWTLQYKLKVHHWLECNLVGDLSIFTFTSLYVGHC